MTTPRAKTPAVKPAARKTPPPATDQPQQEPISTTSASAPEPTDTPDHLEAIFVPDLDEGEADPTAPMVRGADWQEDEPPADDYAMGRDEFYAVFKGAFGFPAMMLPGMAALAIQPEEEAQARTASDAVHRLLEIHYPAALRPGGETLILAMTAGGFLIGKAMIVREVLRARSAKRVGPVDNHTDRAAKPRTETTPEGETFEPVASTSWGAAA